MNPSDLNSLERLIHPPSQPPKPQESAPSPDGDLGSSMVADAQPQPEKVDRPVLENAVSSINAMAKDRGLDFRVDEQSGRIIVSIIDAKTEEVIRQIPPELAVKLAENLSKEGESIRGLVLNVDL